MRGERRHIWRGSKGILGLALGFALVAVPVAASTLPFDLAIAPTNVLNAAQGEDIPIFLTITSNTKGLMLGVVCDPSDPSNCNNGFGINTTLLNDPLTLFDDVATFVPDLNFLFNEITLDAGQTSGPLHFGDLVFGVLVDPLDATSPISALSPIGTDVEFTAKGTAIGDPTVVTVKTEFAVNQGPITPPLPGTVPEPASLVLVGAGLLGAYLGTRRRR